MKFSDNSIEIGRVLSDLDVFTIDFLKILKRYTNYAVISGYVAILLGRARASEDIDIMIPRISFEIFLGFYDNLKKEDYYCLNAEKVEEIFHKYLENDCPVRFTKKGIVIPNIELKFAKRKIDEIALKKVISVKLGTEKIMISNLELQIAFKEFVLKSPRDIEDARHIRNVAKDHLDEKAIEGYKVMLKNEFQ